MEILLRQDYESLGEAGKVVKVKPGYARNYLIPKGIAYIATEANQKRYDAERIQKNWRLEKDKKNAEETAKKLEGISCTIAVQVGEEDKMFGSVTSQNIAERLAEQGFEVDKRKIVLDDPIKALGIYSVPIKLHSEVEPVVKVWVVKE
jgi:large subunit ribosomal protein L9